MKFCQQRATTVLSSRDADLFQNWLLDLLAARVPPPLTERDYDWHAIAHACDVDHADLQRAGPALAPGLDALRRELARRGHVTVKRAAARRAPSRLERSKLQRDAQRLDAVPRRRGPRAKPIVEFPESDGRPWTDPPSFADALDLHMGIKEITKHLNAKGHRTRLGARYGVGTIHGILTNPVYVGEWSFNKRSSKTGQVKPQHEVIPISVPAILNRSTFDKVQKALRAKNPHNSPPRVISGPILLTGLAYCACCGSAMALRASAGRMPIRPGPVHATMGIDSAP